jgi:hypothetical protein
MSDQRSSGSEKPPPPNPCPVCGAMNCPTGYHENVVDKPGTDREPSN